MDQRQNSRLNYFYIRAYLCNPWLNESVVLRNLVLFMPLALISRARLQATLACTGACAFYAWRGGLAPTIATGVTGTLALLAWFVPRAYAPVQHGLDRMLHFILSAFTWVLLGLFYLLIFVPLRLWRGITGHDPLHRQPDAKATTYLQPTPPAAANRFDRQF
jgi:hypothetical protein